MFELLDSYLSYEFFEQLGDEVNLGRAIVDSRGELSGWFAPPSETDTFVKVVFHFYSLSKSKVNDLQNSIITNKYVLRTNISMKNLGRLEIGETVNCLEKYVVHGFWFFPKILFNV